MADKSIQTNGIPGLWDLIEGVPDRIHAALRDKGRLGAEDLDTLTNLANASENTFSAAQMGLEVISDYVWIAGQDHPHPLLNQVSALQSLLAEIICQTQAVKADAQWCKIEHYRNAAAHAGIDAERKAA